MELHFVKNDFRFSSGKVFLSWEKRKLLKPEFMRDIRGWLIKKWEWFDWHLKLIYRIFCFEFFRYF